jgi:hypothetical protein
MIISHRELIRSANSSTSDFETALPNYLNNFVVNPGNSHIFPWLSGIAANFEQFSFRRLAFESVTAYPTTSTGTFLKMFDYDPTDDPPTTLQEFTSNMTTQSAPIWQSCRLNVDISRLNEMVKWRYVGTSANAAVSGQGRTSDCGRFYAMGFNTNLAGQTLLFADYEIALRIPVPGIPKLLNAYSASTENVAVTGVLAPRPFKNIGGTPTLVTDSGGLQVYGYDDTVYSYLDIPTMVGHGLIDMAITGMGALTGGGSPTLVADFGSILETIYNISSASGGTNFSSLVVKPDSHGHFRLRIGDIATSNVSDGLTRFLISAIAATIV